MARNSVRAGARASGTNLKSIRLNRQPHVGTGDWIAGVALGAAGALRYRLFRPPDVQLAERLALLVMLHGCGQDAASFADSTRMNSIAARERFLVLYPEQDRLANSQGCWNWFDTRAGRAAGEVHLIMKAVEQVCLLYRADRDRMAVAGLSAGASMAAILAVRHPDRFRAVVMHSGVPPGAADSTATALAAMRGRRAARPLSTGPALSSTTLPPLMVIHGSTDQVVSASNGREAARIWAGAAGASAGPQRDIRRGKRYPMTVTDFKAGSRTAVTLVEVQQLAHAWSGGAARLAFGDSQGPDASRMLWAFVSRQFRA